MAKVLVATVRGSGQGVKGATDLIVACYFSGGDVDVAIEGQSFETVVRLPVGYTSADLKNGMIAAAQAKGTELGLAVAATDVEVPTFETGV